MNTTPGWGLALTGEGIICAMLTWGSVAWAAAPTTITFDDLPVSWNGYGLAGEIPQGYSGLWWNGFKVMDSMDPPTLFAGTGYRNGVVSGKNLAWSYAGGSPLTPGFSLYPGVFNFDSAYLTSAYVRDLQLEVQGFVGNTLVYDNTYSLGQDFPTLIQFNYAGVDRVVFLPSNIFVIDNVSITIPEPGGGVLMMLAVALGVVGRWWKRG